MVIFFSNAATLSVLKFELACSVEKEILSVAETVPSNRNRLNRRFSVGF